MKSEQEPNINQQLTEIEGQMKEDEYVQAAESALPIARDMVGDNGTLSSADEIKEVSLVLEALREGIKELYSQGGETIQFLTWASQAEDGYDTIDMVKKHGEREGYLVHHILSFSGLKPEDREAIKLDYPGDDSLIAKMVDKFNQQLDEQDDQTF